MAGGRWLLCQVRCQQAEWQNKEFPNNIQTEVPFLGAPLASASNVECHSELKPGRLATLNIVSIINNKVHQRPLNTDCFKPLREIHLCHSHWIKHWYFSMATQNNIYKIKLAVWLAIRHKLSCSFFEFGFVTFCKLLGSISKKPLLYFALFWRLKLNIYISVWHKFATGQFPFLS